MCELQDLTGLRGSLPQRFWQALNATEKTSSRKNSLKYELMVGRLACFLAQILKEKCDNGERRVCSICATVVKASIRTHVTNWF